MENNNTNLVENAQPQSSQQFQGGAGRPAGLPDKFWDETTQSVRLEALIEDYNYMASRDENLIETNRRHLPESYDKYDIKVPSPFMDRDEEVFKKFYEYGFSNEQAQLVYDLANERVIPLLDQLTINFEAQKQMEKLNKYFGSSERFDEVSRQISNWARQNLRPEVYDALASSAEGVITLYKMMSSNEPMLGKSAEPEGELSEEVLRKMMEDPRYWRDKDKAYINKITQGFEKLYPER